jgi:mannose-1-phosphate guanylyltransferase
LLVPEDVPPGDCRDALRYAVDRPALRPTWRTDAHCPEGLFGHPVVVDGVTDHANVEPSQRVMTGVTHVSTDELITELEENEEDAQFAEVLHTESVTVEIGTYPSSSPKNPHTEDEVYYIISGSGMIRAGDEIYDVETGDVVFVEQGLEHDFFNIDEEITALTIFVGSDTPSSYSIRDE